MGYRDSQLARIRSSPVEYVTYKSYVRIYISTRKRGLSFCYLYNFYVIAPAFPSITGNYLSSMRDTIDT